MTKRKPIFESPLPIKNQKKHEIIAGALIFVLVPSINCLIICSGKESAIYNSLSRLAWPEGLLWLVYLWGILNMGCFAYATWLTSRAASYNKSWRVAFYSLEIAFAVILTAGVSIPAYADRGDYYEMLRSIHTAISSVGFFGFLVVLILFTITLFARNRRQALLSAVFNSFMIVVGVFGLVKVSDPASYCHVSAPSQILVFDLFNVSAMLHYYSMTLFPNEQIIIPVDEE